MTSAPTPVPPETDLDAARQQLRERQGVGARYDSPSAPHLELQWARRGSAYFMRELDQLTDAELDSPTLLDGWNRAELVAHVGYNARALTRLCTWASTGIETPMYSSASQRSEEIHRGRGLPGRALRALIHHSKADLDVAWRDLDDSAWARHVRTAQGRTVPATETAWMRCREVWVHAVDLNAGASFDEFPRPLLERLLSDVLSSWRRRAAEPGLVLSIHGHGITTVGSGGVTVYGALSDVTRWVTGRGAAGVHCRDEDAALPTLPAWL